jgi:NADH-quinone oxidoreductase subunit M
LWAPLLAVALLGVVDRKARRIRAFAVGCASVSVIAGAAVFVVPDLEALSVAWPFRAPALLGTYALRVTALSKPLIALPAALWLITIIVTPQRRLDRVGLQRTALACAFGTLAFLTDSPVVLWCCWAVSSALFLSGLVSHRTGVKRVLGRYQAVSAVALGAGIVLTTDVVGLGQELGLWLIILAALVRKGIFPFHAWIPEAFDRGRIGPIVLLSAPQLGTYVAATLVVPHATPMMLRTVAILSLLTALYGAALALFQRDARRALGYLFVSQSALVLAGLDCTSVEALAGALILWVSSAFAFTGMARTVLALEARRGRLDLGIHHGGFEQMPLLATSFLILGLACTGFPGTLGFVGQELLIDGATRSFPTMGLLTIGASALTGLAVLRMYFALFCGRRERIPGLRLRRREAVVFGAVAATLIAAGILPRAIVVSRVVASEAILQDRGAGAAANRGRIGDR